MGELKINKITQKGILEFLDITIPDTIYTKNQAEAVKMLIEFAKREADSEQLFLDETILNNKK